MRFVDKSFEVCASESTCQKRVTVCELYALIPGYEDCWSKPKILISRESNRCAPSDGRCSRLGIASVKENYPSESTCNWEHAEIRALAANSSNLKPYEAVIYGHRFPCPDCEKALRNAGVEWIYCRENRTTGLRNK